MGGENSIFLRWYAAFEEERVPVFPDPGRAVWAARALVAYARFRDRMAPDVPRGGPPAEEETRMSGRPPISLNFLERKSRDTLSEY